VSESTGGNAGQRMADAAQAEPVRPLPVPDALTAPYWDAALEHRLVMPRCIDCGRFHFYPRTLCPHCSSDRLEWTACIGRGEVYSFTIVHRAPGPAFVAEVPYVVATVRLAEGPHLMTRLRGVAPEAVRIGMAVQVAFEQASVEITLPVFEPAEEV
jgi:uncharacterized OB-fold protein